MMVRPSLNPNGVCVHVRRAYMGDIVDKCPIAEKQWRGNDFSTGWSRPTFSSWGSGGAVRPQRGPGQSPGGKRILTTIF